MLNTIHPQITLTTYNTLCMSFSYMILYISEEYKPNEYDIYMSLA